MLMQYIWLVDYLAGLAQIHNYKLWLIVRFLRANVQDKKSKFKVHILPGLNGGRRRETTVAGGSFFLFISIGILEHRKREKTTLSRRMAGSTPAAVGSTHRSESDLVTEGLQCLLRNTASIV